MAPELFYLSPPPFISGSGFIAGEAPGIVTVAGAPARRPIICVHKRTRAIAGAVFSNEEGEYRFEGLSQNERFVLIAFDPQLQFNAVIRDNITPAVDE